MWQHIDYVQSILSVNSILVKEDKIMEYIQLALILFIYTAIIGIFMKVANYVGKKLGVGKVLIYLWQKTRRSK